MSTFNGKDLNALTFSELQRAQQEIIDAMKERQRQLASKLRLGDIVWFNHQNQILEGVVTKINQKTVHVTVNGAQVWRVSPSLLMQKNPHK